MQKVLLTFFWHLLTKASLSSLRFGHILVDLLISTPVMNESPFCLAFSMILWQPMREVKCEGTRKPVDCFVGYQIGRPWKTHPKQPPKTFYCYNVYCNITLQQSKSILSYLYWSFMNLYDALCALCTCLLRQSAVWSPPATLGLTSTSQRCGEHRLATPRERWAWVGDQFLGIQLATQQDSWRSCITIQLW